MSTDQIRLIQALNTLRDLLPQEPSCWDTEGEAQADERKARWLDALLPPTPKPEVREEGGASWPE